MAEQLNSDISIALDMRKNRIRIHKPTIHLLGDPTLIQLLINVQKNIIAINCPAYEVPGGQEIRINPKKLKGDSEVEVYSHKPIILRYASIVKGFFLRKGETLSAV